MPRMAIEAGPRSLSRNGPRAGQRARAFLVDKEATVVNDVIIVPCRSLINGGAQAKARCPYQTPLFPHRRRRRVGCGRALLSPAPTKSSGNGTNSSRGDAWPRIDVGERHGESRPCRSGRRL